MFITVSYILQCKNKICVYIHIMASDGKESAPNAGDIREASSMPGSGRFPWRREWQPTPVFLPGEFHGQRSLVGYSPLGCRVRHD